MEDTENQLNPKRGRDIICFVDSEGKIEKLSEEEARKRAIILSEKMGKEMVLYRAGEFVDEG